MCTKSESQKLLFKNFLVPVALLMFYLWFLRFCCANSLWNLYKNDKILRIDINLVKRVIQEGTKRRKQNKYRRIINCKRFPKINNFGKFINSNNKCSSFFFSRTTAQQHSKNFLSHFFYWEKTWTYFFTFFVNLMGVQNL